MGLSERAKRMGLRRVRLHPRVVFVAKPEEVSFTDVAAARQGMVEKVPGCWPIGTKIKTEKYFAD
jgi:hypothetical protein